MNLQQCGADLLGRMRAGESRLALSLRGRYWVCATRLLSQSMKGECASQLLSG